MIDISGLMMGREVQYYQVLDDLLFLMVIYPIPNCKETNNYTPQTREQNDATNIIATFDSNYAGDTSHRRSVT